MIDVSHLSDEFFEFAVMFFSLNLSAKFPTH